MLIKVWQRFRKKPMLWPSSEPIFKNQLGYHQYQDKQGLSPILHDLHEDIVPDSKEEHNQKVEPRPKMKKGSDFVADGACNDGTLATQSKMDSGGAGSMPNGQKQK